MVYEHKPHHYTSQRTESSHRRADTNIQHNDQQPPECEPQQQELEQAPPSYPPPAPPQEPKQPKRKPQAEDPVTQILIIQEDVMNLMKLLNKFSGDKKDKNYLYIDVTLTDNLIKLDNIETDGNDNNIRTAKREVIKCIQKCLALLEIKVEMYQEAEEAAGEKPNEDVDMEEPKEEILTDPTQQHYNVEAEIQTHPETTVTPPSHDFGTKERPLQNDSTKPGQGRNARNKSREDIQHNMQVDEPVEQRRVLRSDNYHSSNY